MDILKTIRVLKQKQSNTSSSLHTRPQLQAAIHGKHRYAVNKDISDNSLGGPDVHDNSLADGEAKGKKYS